MLCWHSSHSARQGCCKYIVKQIRSVFGVISPGGYPCATPLILCSVEQPLAESRGGGEGVRGRDRVFVGEGG